MVKKDFVKLTDFSREELIEFLDFAGELKEKTLAGNCPAILTGKTLAMIFEKPSTRTRVSFEVGMYQLGGQALNLEPSTIQVGQRESIADVARTLSRFVQGIMLRTFSHQTIEDFAKYSSVPVINGLSDYNHPAQALADIMTIYEKKGREQDLTLSYIGDGNNVLHSLMHICAILGIKLRAACPEGYMPDEKTVAKAKDIGGKDCFCIHADPQEAVKDTDVIYTDVWASMGQESEAEARKQVFKPFQINSQLLGRAKKDVIVMHCLPAHRGEEITGEVLDSEKSVVFDQAENRLHAQKAVLAKLL